MQKDGEEQDHSDSEHAPLFEVECGSGSRYGARMNAIQICAINAILGSEADVAGGNGSPDICSKCWNQLAQKLKGKRRVMNQETVFLPPPRAMEEPEVDEPKPLPEEPQKICGGTDVDVTLH